MTGRAYNIPVVALRFFNVFGTRQALSNPYTGVLANYDFSADDMTGIPISSFIFSKLVGGKYTRTPFRVTQ